MDNSLFPHSPSSTLALKIDLKALVHNYHHLCSHLKAKTQCGAVLKADAYGMGLQSIAPCLYQEGCRHFFVAHLQEAFDLKSYVGNDSHIYVLNGLRRGDEELYALHDLIPILGDPYQIHLWNSFCQRKQKSLKAALHFDTGITRTGLSSKATESLGLLQVSHMEIVCVMSHLTCAYDPSHPMNKAQYALFDTYRKRFPFALGSLSGSGGVFLDPSYHYDLVRPGLALTGCRSAVPIGPYCLKPVVKAYAQVLQMHEISVGDSVGYNKTFIASRPSRIATLGVGYADGYLRSLSNAGEIYFKGQKLPVVGNVSMDLTAIDVTDVPGDKIYPGDWVELFGENLLIDDLAEKANTIPWEILTRLGPRFERFYTQEQTKTEAA